jgi:arylsulfatase A-like enzyme
VGDIQATIAELVGFPAGAADGVSALEDTPRAAFFFTDYSQPWVGLRDGCWKYVLDVSADRGRLFDVCTDPNETIDRLADGSRPSTEGRAYRARALQWLSATRAPLTRSDRAPSGWW